VYHIFRRFACNIAHQTARGLTGAVLQFSFLEALRNEGSFEVMLAVLDKPVDHPDVGGRITKY
jgi:hypothetical protein